MVKVPVKGPFDLKQFIVIPFEMSDKKGRGGLGSKREPKVERVKKMEWHPSLSIET